MEEKERCGGKRKIGVQKIITALLNKFFVPWLDTNFSKNRKKYYNTELFVLGVELQRNVYVYIGGTDTECVKCAGKHEYSEEW